MSIPTYQIQHETHSGRQEFTLFVFGPYDGLYDVEIYSGSIDYPHGVSYDTDGDILSESLYVGTVSDVVESGIANAVSDWLDAHV